MTTNYQRGADFERRVVADLTPHGYECFRAAGSRGKADVVAIKPGQIVLIQCKRDGKISRDEWNDLVALAIRLQPSMVFRRVVFPILALMPGRTGIEYRWMTGPVMPGQQRVFRHWSPDPGGEA